jgi:hypothetical protein
MRQTVRQTIFSTLVNAIDNNPELFYMGNSYSLTYTLTSSSTGKFVKVTPEYTMTKSQAKAVKVKFDQEASKAAAVAKPSMSDVEKAKAVHDYLILRAEYDMVNYKKKSVPMDSYRAHGVLVNKVGVCKSYAMAYKYILEDKLGITCGYARTNSHIWNMVKIGSTYYNVDTTWDDGTKTKINTKFFLVSGTVMQQALPGQKISYQYSPAKASYKMPAEKKAPAKEVSKPAKVKMSSVKGGAKKLTIKWKKAGGATGYEVYISTQKGKGYKKIKTITKAKTVQYTKTKLKKGTRYYVKVRAYKTVSSKKYYGSFSTVISAKTKK